jgi:hypothetical protein
MSAAIERSDTVPSHRELLERVMPLKLTLCLALRG